MIKRNIAVFVVLLLLGAGVVAVAGESADPTVAAESDDDGTTDQGPGVVGHFDDDGRPEGDDRDDDADDLDDNSGPGNADDDADDDNSGPGNADDDADDDGGDDDSDD